MERVVIFLDELPGGVADGPGEVSDEEAVLVPDLAVRPQLGLAGQRQSEVAAVVVVHCAGEVLTVGLRQLGLLV